MRLTFGGVILRKITAFLIVFVLLLSVSCGKKESSGQELYTTRPFTCIAEISYDSLSLEAKLTYRNAAGATLEVLSPDSFEGLIFEYNGEETRAFYKGISFSLGSLNSSLPSAAKLIFSSLVYASNQKDTRDSGEHFVISGRLDSAQYELYFNKKSGYLEKFICPSLNFEAKFKDFKFLE